MSLTTTIKGVYKKGKDIATNAPEIERKVKDATSNEKWGPTGTQMQEISRATFNFHDFPTIMMVIWKRINDPGKYWRHVYKSLLLIDYLIRNGSEQVIRECRNHLIEIQTLTEFQYIEEDKDVGLSVRERAKQVIELLHDDRRIKTEREKAKANRDKYKGVGNDNSGYGGSYEGGYDRNDSYDRPSDSYDYGGSRPSNYSDQNEYRDDDNSRYEERERYDRPQDDYEEPEPEPPRQQPKPAAQPSSNNSNNANAQRRPRAASGGKETIPQPTQSGTLFAIDDVFNQPAQPQSASNELFESFGQAPPSFGMPNSFPQGNNQGSFFPPTTGGLNAPNFDPRGNTEQEGFGDFVSPNQPEGFNPFDQQNAPIDPNANQQPRAPEVHDPWAQKGLFDLNNLNTTEKPGAQSKPTGPSPNKTPMASMPSKAPMAPAKGPTISSGPTFNPAAGRGMPMGGPNYGAAVGMGVGVPPGPNYAPYGNPQYGAPMGNMGMVPPGYAPTGYPPGVGMAPPGVPMGYPPNVGVPGGIPPGAPSAMYGTPFPPNAPAKRF